ncbi:MarR family winged helix-turn-helix transcriptional regulator [Paenibacillus sp. GCM10012307]|uniref:MarR family transcriptional regulator n=1 Tax=Paenibacillus roseus TaxID=2798579 RepID=A0A934J572_9BACL|nr:MarR family transcriptional regulator [Paenibacillus roseus]MBJ6360635.1 MarR family transcriptional regulator [Paenibacillus roseus]
MDQIDELRKDIILDIYRASNLLERVGRGIAIQHGLTSIQQWFIIGTLFRSPEGQLTLKELSENILVTKQNMTGMVRRLEQAGHIVTWKDPADRRSTRARLTESGKQVFHDLRNSGVSSNVRSFSFLNDEETRSFALMLERLVSELQQLEAADKPEHA